jgi:hypothetical protein
MKHEISLVAKVLSAYKAEVVLACVRLDVWWKIRGWSHATRAPSTELAWILQRWLLLMW